MHIVKQYSIEVVTQFESEGTLSVPNGTGQKGRFKTVRIGMVLLRPPVRRAGRFRSASNETESRPAWRPMEAELTPFSLSTMIPMSIRRDRVSNVLSGLGGLVQPISWWVLSSGPFPIA